MEIVTVGLNHHKAPVEMRAKLAPLGADVPGALRVLTQKAPDRDSGLTEGAIISTCKTPGTMGNPGKWSMKKGSEGEKLRIPTALFPGSISTNLSIRIHLI